MVFYDPIRIGASGDTSFEVERSLRFNDDDSPYLEATPSAAGSNQMTFSFWIKRGNLGTNQTIFSSGVNNARGHIYFQTDNTLRIQPFNSSGANAGLQTKRVFRDVGAWYHIVVNFNNSAYNDLASTANVYVNGVSTEFTADNYNVPTGGNRLNDAQEKRIGEFRPDDGGHYDGYLAEFNFIDGQVLTPSSFGETNEITGQWVPIDTSGLTFGTEGFRLQFADNSGTTATTLGKDTSGQSNNWTPNNFAVSDVVLDTPSNNFSTLDILSESGGTYSEGNLKIVGAQKTATSTLAFKTGKFYYEVYVDATGDNNYVGVLAANFTGIDPARGGNWITHGGLAYQSNQNFYRLVAGTTSSNRVTYGATYTAGDIIGVAVDIDNDTITFYKNGSSQGNTASGITYLSSISAKEFFYAALLYPNGGNNTMRANFGQDSTFQGTVSAGGNKDNNGNGDFKYTVPSGFLAMCTKNLPDPTIVLPTDHFQTVIYEGDGTASTGTRSFSNVTNFQPDFIWLKSRTIAYSHLLYDAVRGAGSLKGLQSNSTTTEGGAQDNQYYGFLASFDATGFSVTKGDESPTNAKSYTNTNTEDYVAWAWNGGSSDGATYRVVVVSDGGNKYRFRNSANTSTFAVSAVELNLAEGGTYTFDQSDSTMSSHPMKLSTTANGTHGGGTSYNTGVTYQLDGSTVTESAFVSGFSSATSRKLIITVAASAPTLYYYCHYHSGMGGQANTNSTLGSSNFDGDTTPADEVPTVKANPSAGFSIVKYKGQSGNYKVGHGLGVTPELIITKTTGAADSWWTYTTVGDKTLDWAALNLTQAFQNVEGYNLQLPTNLTFDDDDDFTDNNQNAIAYLFSSVTYFSKVGRYTGNGSADGPFIHLGFRPAFFLQKRWTGSGSGGWYIFDSKRAGFNVDNDILVADTGDSGFDGQTYPRLDFTSNGVKWRDAGSAVHNENGVIYIYLAFAEAPSKYSRAR